MEAYKVWVRRNRQWLSSIESIANTLTWFLPERFAKSELAPEAVSTLVGLVTVMNEHIIATAPCRTPGDMQAVSERERCFPWPLLVSVVKEMEVLVEMGAEYYCGKDHKWAPVATIEAAKVLMRLLVLHKSGYKMLIDGGETPNVEGPDRPSNPDLVAGASRPAAAGSTIRLDGESRAMEAMLKYRGNFGGSTRPSWLVAKSVSPFTQAPRENSSQTRINSWEDIRKVSVLGELLLIVRPLLYVLLIRRYGLRSWRPWVSSLAIDVAAMTLLYSVPLLPGHTTETQLRQRAPLSRLEKNELRRRQLLWALYVMRSPFFNNYTKRPLEKAEHMLKPVPLFGTLAGKAVELVLGIQAFYTYTGLSGMPR